VLPLAQLLELLDQSQERIEVALSHMDLTALARTSAGDAHNGLVIDPTGRQMMEEVGHEKSHCPRIHHP
jgi:hypothetical protein